MSVLSFPRIYFKGYMEWDPCTFNNNDWQAFPTYDCANAALNWSFLATQGTTPDNPQGITPANFGSTFRPWAITLQDDTNPNDNPPPGKRIPAEWNMFGSHGVSFVQYDKQTTTIIGGALELDKPVTSDPLIGTPVSISGDGGQGPGRLVDVNPASFWSSQIYYDQLQFGSKDCHLSGPRRFRMYSRWQNLSRIYNQDKLLTQPAAGVAACFQTCIPFVEVNWTTKGVTSPLMEQLRKAASQPGALGIMVRFTAYVNLYFQNGNFNSIGTKPRTYEELASALSAAWADWYSSGGSKTSQFFSNPCYSHIVGAVGVWNDGELATVPGGRYLVAQTPVAPVNPTATASTTPQTTAGSLGHALQAVVPNVTENTITLGPVVTSIDYKSHLISLDFSSAIPENGVSGDTSSNLIKADFGPLSIGVMANGKFTSIVTLKYKQYQKSAYEASAGIIDVPFPSKMTELLKSGTLAIQAQKQTALMEQVYTAQTDNRGIYLDQGEQSQFKVTVCQKGVSSPGVKVLVVKYDNNLNLIPTVQPQFVNFTNGSQQIIQVPLNSQAGSTPTRVTVVTADDNGVATVGIAAQSPGFPVLALFPYAADDQTMPQPPMALIGPPPAQGGPPYRDFITNAFYTTARVLPFDDDVPGQFISLWNSTHDPAQAWTFIYDQILYVYDMLFNVMLNYVNLGSRQDVEKNIDSISYVITKKAAAESTHAMPITRDMSAGKRTALQLWIYLVKKNYKVPSLKLSVLAPPSTKRTKKEGEG